MEYLDRAIAELDALIATQMAPYQAEAARLQTSTGIDTRTAEALIAELGVDMAVFPSDRHCASWTGLCPGHNESAGKRKSGKPRQGNKWLRTALVAAAWAASHTRTYLGAQDPSARPAPREEEGDCSCSPQYPGDRLPHPEGGDHVS